MEFKGLSSLESVLAIFKDPKLFEKQLSEIKEATKQYQTVVEAVVSLSSVNDFVASISKREEESIKNLEDAKVKSADIIAKAKQKASTIETSITEKNKELLERETLLKEKEENVRIRSSNVSEREREVAEKMEQLSIKSTELAKGFKELSERQAKLKAALSA